MVLWRPDGFADDGLARLPTIALVPATGAIIVSLGRARGARDACRRAPAPVGVAVEAGADAQAHLVDLVSRPLIALAFA